MRRTKRTVGVLLPFSGYDAFVLTLTDRTCEVCGERREFMDTPGRCVECAARELLAKRLQARGADTRGD
jgi:hypothetical protein